MRDEDGVELEPLRAVQRQQMDSAARLAAVAEAAFQLRDERRPVELRELLRERDEPSEVALPYELALAEAVLLALLPARIEREAAGRQPGMPSFRSTNRAASRARNDEP